VHGPADVNPAEVLTATARRHGVADLLRRSALRRPDHRALVWDGGVDTFEALDRTVTRVANAVRERGVSKGDRVVMFAHNSRDFVAFYFALARLGAISVPVNFMLNSDELAFIVQHAQPVGFVVEDLLAHTMQSGWRQAMGDTPPRLQAWIRSTEAMNPPVS
jgi:fatty-acyl-CoA synthase